jgi:hypothetical protein
MLLIARKQDFDIELQMQRVGQHWGLGKDRGIQGGLGYWKKKNYQIKNKQQTTFIL